MGPHALILGSASGKALLLAWAILLLAALPVILWTVARKVEGRGAGLLLAAVILLVTAGQFGFFAGHVLPGMEREAGLLRDKIALLEQDGVKERDMAVAYQRENATLNQTVLNLRTTLEELERRAGEGDAARPAGPPAPPPAPARAPDGPAHALPRLAAPPRASSASPCGFRPRDSNSRYSITLITPEENAAQARDMEAALRALRYRTEATLWIEVDENRIVYYADEDRERAGCLAAFLMRELEVPAGLRLAPSRRNQGRFQVYLKP